MAFHSNALCIKPLQFHRTVGVQVEQADATMSDGGMQYAQNDAWLLDGIMAIRKMNAEVPRWSLLPRSVTRFGRILLRS